MKLLTLLCILFPSLVCIGSAKEKPGALTPEQSVQLQRDKIIVTPKTWTQVFTPYIFAQQPVFITSDSALQAFYVLLEKSMTGAENLQALRLPQVLEAVLGEIKEEPPDDMKPEDFPAAAKRARLVLGIAARLAGSDWSGGAELDRTIAAEVARIEAAAEVIQPPWMEPGHGMVAMDYRVFKPVSFYERSTRLQRFFRAVRWLQSVPFRARVPEEMSALAVVAEALFKEGSLPRMQELYQSLGGSLLENNMMGKQGMQWDPVEEIGRWREVAAEGSWHLTIMGALDVPDAQVFQRTTSVARPMPDVLEIGAWLGSPLASELIQESAGTKVLDLVKKTKPESGRRMKTIYGGCLDCAAILLAPPEPDAPPFMSSVPWQRKSLNTALGSWTQLRHAFALHAKMNANVFPAAIPYPGFVEPNPAFFHALARVILQCVNDFDDVGALEPTPDMIVMAAAEVLPRLVAEEVEIRRKMALYHKQSAEGHNFTAEEIARMEEDCRPSAQVMEMLQPLAGIVDGLAWNYPGYVVTGFQDMDKALVGIREIAAGKRMDDIRRHQRRAGGRTLRNRWLGLLSVVQQLESRSHRQLRGLEPSVEEARFIVGYGELLGSIMLYEGNSYHLPLDDAPRVASVFHQAGGAFLLAATGRARELRLLYPWKGKEILCRGAIVPFYTWPSGTQLTDTEWKSRLDETNPPVLPEWMQPLLSPLSNPQKLDE